MAIKKVRAPVRIDFGGGTTDIFPFTHTHGGAVLNAAINRYVYGTLLTSNKDMKLEYSSNIPTSSGLGTSSAMNVVWTSLITKDMKDKNKIAEAVYKIEQSISESKVNGKQDQYAAAFGGINYMEFKKDKVIIHPIKLKKEFLKKFEDSLVLVYSGQSHYSGKSNKAAIDNLLKGKNTQNLVALKKIANQMRDALLKEDLEKFAELMNQETEQRKKLAASTLSPEIKKIIDTGLKNGAKGAKICGSGGGGSILFLGDKNTLKKKFGSKVIDFKFDFEGVIRMNI